MNMTPTVCILLSSYNGEKYIKEQIDSVLNQERVCIELVIRDDGSTDKTVEIIKSYGDKIKLILGKNVGCENSFAELLKCVSSNAKYYAFCDQDDYWLPNKVITEIEAIQDCDGPALATCNLLLCDGELNVQGPLHSDDRLSIIKQKMDNDFLCNMHGCVLLWNKKLHDLLSINVPNDMVSHDGWVNTVANAIGTTIIVKESLIKYRIHGNNVAGHASSPFQRIKKGLRRYLGKNHPKRDCMAKDIIASFGDYMDVNSNGYKTLYLIAHYKDSFRNKIKLMHMDIIKKDKLPDRWLWKLCILLNKY